MNAVTKLLFLEINKNINSQVLSRKNKSFYLRGEENDKN